MASRAQCDITPISRIEWTLDSPRFSWILLGSPGCWDVMFISNHRGNVSQHLNKTRLLETHYIGAQNREWSSSARAIFYLIVDLNSPLACFPG